MGMSSAASTDATRSLASPKRHFAHELVHEPFEVGGRGGAGFDGQPARPVKAGLHEDWRLVDGLVQHHLIDAPTAGDDGGLTGLRHARAQRARHHVEQASDHRRSRDKTRQRRHFRGYSPGDISAFEQFRQHGHGVGQVIELH
jgi:hypothetical protein